MRRVVLSLVCVLAILGMLAPPSLAQQPPPAATPPPPPAPKVTITGLVDFATSIYKNAIGGDITDGGRDHGWYSRERGVFTLTGEVGRVKGVLAMEFDVVNGSVGDSATPNVGVNSNFSLNGGLAAQSSTNLDFGTDVNDVMELKWLYIEAPITGEGSLLPFIPVTTIGRFGGQPLTGHEYKPGTFAMGDFAGVNMATTWAPNLRTILTYVQIDEALRDDTVAGFTGAHKTDDFAFISSLEWDIFKGLTVKPSYSYVRFDGGSNAAIANPAKGGFTPNGAAQANRKTARHTFGADARWTFGPWSISPTFFYQTGTQETVAAAAGGKSEVDINAWIFDIIAGFRSGPLTIELRGSLTPGMKASQCVVASGTFCNGGHDINYYVPFAADPVFWAGWSEIESSSIDYIASFNPATGTRLGSAPSYDKYGRRMIGLAADYALTPALAFHLFTIAQWTDEKVDTQATVANGLTPVSAGDARYLGTEAALGLTYRFAPNIALDLVGAVLFVGEARDHGRTAASTTDTFDADNVYRLSARLRVTF
jgi:hypothetical protein